MPRVALVFCAHHKPWLMMSTLLTVTVQDSLSADLFFAYNVGDGKCADKESYREYHRLTEQYGINRQLSPFDPRVRDVCRISYPSITELEFENDQALDSGAWYKFIKTGQWRGYDYVFFIGEGTLLTSSRSLSAMLSFAETNGIHVIASAHEKRRIPREQFLRNSTRRRPHELDAFHSQMIAEAFAVFCRDPAFRELYEAWGSDFPLETQDHVPDIWGNNGLWGRVLQLASAQPPANGASLRRLAAAEAHRSRRALLYTDALRARLELSTRNIFQQPAVGALDPGGQLSPDERRIHVNGARRRLREVVPAVVHDGVSFHRVREPEWFGCATLHMMSGAYLERLSRKLDAFALYDVLDIPFAGTALEVVWGFLPQWLGFEKWFTDGFHRVRKNFTSYGREDDPPGMAWYLNRYYRGSLCVGWVGDHMKLWELGKGERDPRPLLNSYYY